MSSRLSLRSARVVPLVLAAAVLVYFWHPGRAPAESPASAERVPWTGSKVVGSPDPPPPFRCANAFPNVKLDHPLVIARAPGIDRLFIGEQAGRIVSVRTAPDAQAEVFFDLRKELKTVKEHPGAAGVEAVYGLVFHPKFAENRTCFVCYTLRGKKGEKNLPDGTRVSRFKVVGDGPPRIDPASEEILLTCLQGGHNGGDLHFGPDGYLYITTGDAADPNPPDFFLTGQDITDLLSSVLRIDVDHKDPGKNYAVPKDNPFVGLKVGDKEARPEVWAYGFRNPWRMSFDRATGDLWLGDVGWELWEMVHKVERGGNYGWSVVEARQPVNTHLKAGPTPVRPPVIEIPHTAGASVTGGYVYRGKKFPELVGTYVFGDWETRRIWSAKVSGTELVALTELVTPTVRVVAFGEDAAGELYFLDYDAGTVHTLARNDAPAYDPSQFPTALSATGLFTRVREHAPAPGVYPFEVNAKQWQDYATAERFVALPGRSAVLDHEQKKPIPGNVDWHHFRYHFPKDAVLVKTISLDLEQGNPATRRRVETQLLHFDGENWHGYTYAWRDDQTDADLVPADGSEKQFAVKDPRFGGGVRHQTWTFHSRSQCLQCHNAWAEYPLGFQPEQLNREVRTAAGSKNQLAWLGSLGLLQRAGKGEKPQPVAAEGAAKQKKLADPAESQAPLADRARAYLHANCGHCHRFGGGGAVDFELHADADLSKKVLDAKPTRGTFDLPDARLIAPGNPFHSVIYYRMAKFGSGHMPQLGADFPDPAGLVLIREWITQLPTPPGVKSDRVPGPVESSGERLEQYLSSPANALQLTGMQATGVNSPRLLAAAAKLPAGNVRDLFEGYLPHDPAQRKLGQNPRPRAILSLKGDAAKGRELFFAEKSRCATCHKVDGQGQEIGPDLSAIAKTRTREHLLESILEPSRKIEPQYQPYLVKTHDDRVFTALLVRRDAKEVVLRDSQAKEVRLAAGDVESVQPARESVMPAGLLADFTPQQAADLLEFLATRK